jgi:hypothetical protein
MQFDIRTAALDDLAEQRIRLAVSLLPAYRLRGRLGAWDGTRCDLLIAAAGDAYGHRALSLAQRRGTPVMALGAPLADLGTEPISPASPASVLARLMRDRLQAVAPDTSPVGEADPIAPLCRLAVAPLRGRAVDVVCSGRTILLRPQLGRVYAASHSDLLAVADGMSGSPWQIESSDRIVDSHDLVSASIESFLLRTAQRAADRLPAFADGRYRLHAWPDLGSVPAYLDALRVARLLIRNAMTPEEIARTDGMPERRRVDACLWAFAAANLLSEAGTQRAAPPRPPRPARVQSGLWSSLARRFGLLPQ